MEDSNLVEMTQEDGSGVCGTGVPMRKLKAEVVGHITLPDRVEMAARTDIPWNGTRRRKTGCVYQRRQKLSPTGPSHLSQLTRKEEGELRQSTNRIKVPMFTQKQRLLPNEMTFILYQNESIQPNNENFPRTPDSYETVSD